MRRLYFASALACLAAAFASKYYQGPGNAFSEAYLGDFFVVGVFYFLVGAAAHSMRPFAKAAAIALFAAAVELFQASGIPASWNLPRPFTFLLGTSFDPLDFLFYALGLTAAVAADVYFLR